MTTMSQTLKKMEGTLVDRKYFPILAKTRQRYWREIYKIMSQSGKPYALRIASEDKPRNVLISARGCLTRFLDGKCILECTISTESGVSTLWIRLMQKENPFEYYQEAPPCP